MTSKWEPDFNIVASSGPGTKRRAKQRSFADDSAYGQKKTSSASLTSSDIGRRREQQSPHKPKAKAEKRSMNNVKSRAGEAMGVVRYARPSTAQGSRVSTSQRMYLKSKHSVSGIRARVRRNPREKEIEEAGETKWDSSCSLEYKQRLSQGIHNLHPSEVLDWITDVPEFFRSNREVAFIEQSDPDKRRARRMKYSIVCQTLNAPDVKEVNKVVVKAKTKTKTRSRRSSGKAGHSTQNKLKLLSNESKPISGGSRNTVSTQQSEDINK